MAFSWVSHSSAESSDMARNGDGSASRKESRRYVDLHDYQKASGGVLKFAERTKPKCSRSRSHGIEDSHGSCWVRDRRLGEGSFASVFLAKSKAPTDPDSHLPPEIAVKSSLMENSSSLQFEREVLHDLAFCFNVVHCYGDEITRTKSGEEVYNILLEYCSGSSLHDHIIKFGPQGLPESKVRRYTRDIVRGLYYIHASNYIHCDIKPRNILLTPGLGAVDDSCLVAKIADFGLAKKMTAELFHDRIRGTRPYMSPELVRDYHLDWPADIWALGCVVVEMLSGKQVWSSGNTHEKLLTRIGYSNEMPEIPSGLSWMGRDFLEKCLIRSPYKRTPAWLLIGHPFLSV